MSPENLRKLIKEQLQNKLISGKLSECYLNGKEDKIKEHVEQELKIFTEKIKNLTNENKYPYVRYHLTNIIKQLEKEISKGDYQALGWDEVLF